MAETGAGVGSDLSPSKKDPTTTVPYDNVESVSPSKQDSPLTPTK